MLSNLDYIINFLKQGEKKPGLEKIGVEIEHFMVDEAMNAVSYSGRKGVENILKELSQHYDNSIFEKENLLGLANKKRAVSLEPGSQLEVSIGKFKWISEIEREYQDFVCEIKPVLEKTNYKLAMLGYQPKSKIKDIEQIPKSRYSEMRKHFLGTGSMGENMMRGSASTQVIIDYFSESDFCNKYRLANILSPILSFLTDNTIMFEGKKSFPFTRVNIWENVDNSRCGLIENSLNTSNFGYSEYARYILQLKIIAGNKGFPSMTAEDYLRKHTASVDNISHAMSLCFPNVRVRQYIEIRVADSMPIKYVLGYIALIKGIFYSANNLELLLKEYSFVKDADAKDAYFELKEKQFSAKVYNKKALDLINELIVMAKCGLPQKEQKYLQAIKELVDVRHRPLNLIN